MEGPRNPGQPGPLPCPSGCPCLGQSFQARWSQFPPLLLSSTCSDPSVMMGAPPREEGWQGHCWGPREDRDQGSTNLHPKSQLLEDAPTTGPLGWFLVVGMGTTPWSGGVCRPFNW